jgi:hypothetical protein
MGGLLVCRAGAEAPPVYQNELVVRCQRLHRGKCRRRIENIAVDEHNPRAVSSPLNPLHHAHPLSQANIDVGLATSRWGP